MNISGYTACLILTTGREEENFEIFWARRSLEKRFIPGFHAFLGGQLDEEDLRTPMHAPPSDETMRALLACGARELFEELGILFTTKGAYSAVTNAVWRQHRERILQAEVSFSEFLQDLRLAIDASRYIPAGRWTSPSWMEMHQETEFFQVHIRDDERETLGVTFFPEFIDTHEMHDAEWITPAQGLRAHRAADVYLSAPTLNFLHHFQRNHRRDVPKVRCDEADLGFGLHKIERAGGIHMLPLKSPTIPPSTHTNCIMVGEGQFILIDPGSEEREELEVLFGYLDERFAQGESLQAIVLTHHHVDHVCGIRHIFDKYGPREIWAHEKTAALLEPYAKEQVSQRLEDEQRLSIGEHTLECLFTPGHAPGHLAFVHEETQQGIVGDLIASQGTILVRPPEGHMGDYLASLRRVRARDLRALYPAHGDVVLQSEAKLTHYLEHRQAREDLVEKALRNRGDARVAPLELVPEVYTDVPAMFWPIAAFSLQAHLEHLVELGLAQREGDRFFHTD